MRLNIAILFLALFSFSSCDQVATEEKLISPSGYEYIHHIANEGNKPQVGDKVTFHMEVFKNDTSLLQSTYKSNSPFPQIIPDASKLTKPYPPTYEALLLMAVGDSLTMYQRLDSLPNLPPQFTKDDIIKFNMKVLSIESAADIAAKAAAAKAKGEEITKNTQALIKEYAAGKLNAQIKSTDSGLKYIIHQEGTGAQAVAGKTVDVHYSGFLTDGTGFDSSYKTGNPISFPLGKGAVIKGWDEGIALLKEGSKATFFIPYELAYGETGSPPRIPAKAELVFYVNLEKVQ